MKGRSPAAYALALRGTGGPMKHRNTPRGGRSLEMENLLAAAEEELREEERERMSAAVRRIAERKLRQAQDRYGITDKEMRGDRK